MVVYDDEYFELPFIISAAGDVMVRFARQFLESPAEIFNPSFYLGICLHGIKIA